MGKPKAKPKLMLNKTTMLKDNNKCFQNSLRITKVCLLIIIFMILLSLLLLAIPNKNHNNSYFNNSEHQILNNTTKDLENIKNLTKNYSYNLNDLNLSNNNYNLTNYNNNNSLRIFVKILKSIDNNTVRLIIRFPEEGYYYISISSKDKNLRLIDICNGNIIYKNTTQIELFEKITEKEKQYNLIISKSASSIEDNLNISISKIEIR